MREQLEKLRQAGYTYRQIDKEFGLPAGKAWIILNRERQRANSLESMQRWRARGRTALCDMEDSTRKREQE